MPDPASAQVKVTVTAVLFQPIAFGGGLGVAVIVGGVVSSGAVRRISTVRDAPGLPRSSTAI